MPPPANHPPRPPPKAPFSVTEIGTGRAPRAKLKSADDVEEVVRRDQAVNREGQLLAQLSTEQQRVQDLEEQLRRRVEPAPRVVVAESGETFPPPARRRPPPAHESVAPGPDETSIRVRNVRNFGLLIAALSTAAGSLVVGIVNSVRSTPPAPVVIDKSVQIAEQAKQLGALEVEVGRLRKLADDEGAFVAAVLEASCIDIRRPANATALPTLDVTYPVRKPAKCPTVRIETLQPTYSTTDTTRR